MKNLSAYISEGIFTQDANLLDEDMVVNAIYDLARTHIKKFRDWGSSGPRELKGMDYDCDKIARSKHIKLELLRNMKLVGFQVFLQHDPSSVYIDIAQRKKDEIYGEKWHGFKMYSLDEQIMLYELIKQELESRR